MKKYIYVFSNIIVVFNENDYLYSFVHPQILKRCMLDCICNVGDVVKYYRKVNDNEKLERLIKKYEDMYKKTK